MYCVSTCFNFLTLVDWWGGVGMRAYSKSSVFAHSRQQYKWYTNTHNDTRGIIIHLSLVEWHSWNICQKMKNHQNSRATHLRGHFLTLCTAANPPTKWTSAPKEKLSNKRWKRRLSHRRDKLIGIASKWKELQVLEHGFAWRSVHIFATRDFLDTTFATAKCNRAPTTQF